MSGGVIYGQNGKPNSMDNPVYVYTVNGGGGVPADDSITTAMIQDGAVTTEKLATGAVTWTNVAGKPATFAPTIGTTATTAAAGNHTHAAATTGAAGFMAAADKQKLDGISSNAVNASGAVSAVAAKAQIAALMAIADPATASVTDCANKINEIIAALKA